MNHYELARIHLPLGRGQANATTIELTPNDAYATSIEAERNVAYGE